MADVRNFALTSSRSASCSSLGVGAILVSRNGEVEVDAVARVSLEVSNLPFLQRLNLTKHVRIGEGTTLKQRRTGWMRMLDTHLYAPRIPSLVSNWQLN
jgi:hypothetical protein